MANIRWEPKAQAVRQVTTITIAGTWEASTDQLTLTINNKSLTVTLGTSATTADVATLVKEAWEDETLTDSTASYTPTDGGQDETLIEFGEITATVSGSVVTLTMDEGGIPFTISRTVNDVNVAADPPTATLATATAATGPNFWDNTANWEGGAVPGGADDVFIDNTDIGILYALDQPSGTLASFNVGQSFTGDIGLPKENPAGYTEYRDDYLQIDCGTLLIGRGEGLGSGRIKIESDAGTATTLTVVNTGPRAETDLESVLWKGTNINNVLECSGGSVGVAVFGGEGANLLTLRNTGGNIRCGSAVAFTASAGLTNDNGTLDISSATVTITNNGGTTIVRDTATVTTININGGRVRYLSTANLTTLNVGSAAGRRAIMDYEGDNTPSKNVTGVVTLKPGGEINDPANVAVFDNGITVDSTIRRIVGS